MTGNVWNAQQYQSTYAFVAQYGDEVLELLDVKPGERVLDLGCGTGRHADALAQAGALVIGLDADPSMLAAARHEYPYLQFVDADAASFALADLGTTESFDACFSNAALHWMVDQASVLANVRAVLRTGARFVAEMGGASNIAALDASLRAALGDLQLSVPVPVNYFPTVGEQATALEEADFRVEFATWFRRPTPLGEGTTAADWTRHFRAAVWAAVPASMHARLAEGVDRHAAESGLHPDQGWVADYCRLRFVAIAD